MTLPDVAALVRDLRPILLGSQVSNVYDIDSKTYEFKLSLPASVSAASVAAVMGEVALPGTVPAEAVGKVNLLMESGV